MLSLWSPSHCCNYLFVVCLPICTINSIKDVLSVLFIAVSQQLDQKVAHSRYFVFVEIMSE